MRLKRLGKTKIQLITNRRCPCHPTRQPRHYAWRERMKERIRVKKELQDLQRTVAHAWSDERFLDRVTCFCKDRDFLLLHQMGTMFQSTREKQKLESWNSELKNTRFNLAQSGFYANTDHFVQRNLHTDCIFLTNKVPELPIVIDTGASISLTPNRDDFVSFEATESSVHGIGAVSKVLGTGKVRWKIYDMNNKTHVIETRALYMPEATIRLFSPQTHFQEHNNGEMHVTPTRVNITFPNNNMPMVFPFQQGNNLPLILPLSQKANTCYYPTMLICNNSDTQLSRDRHIAERTTLQLLPDTSPNQILNAITDERNANLTSAQKELLAWHLRWGHMSMTTIQKLMHPNKSLDNDRTEDMLCHPTVIHTKYKTTHTCVPPQCAACNLAKQSRTSIRTKSTPSSTDGSLKVGDVFPGRTVSMDQYVVPLKGRTIASSNPTIVGGTIFVDHSSGRIFIHNQSDLGAASTLVGKHLLERDGHHLGIQIKNYVSDNGIFTSSVFQNDIARKDQHLHLSGVGAHHQNGVAERAIMTITSLTRAMLIHSALTWPDANDISLWPFCMLHAAHIYNHTPGRDGLCPEERWSGTKASYDHMRNLHPWGCPAYVLHPTLQDGKKLPKWSARSRQGKFIGYSPHHASSVALILNRTTHRVSPQFHVLFDDYGSTVRGVDADSTPDLTQFDWDGFIRLHTPEAYVDSEEDIPPPDNWNEESPFQREMVNTDFGEVSDEDDEPEIPFDGNNDTSEEVHTPSEGDSILEGGETRDGCNGETSERETDGTIDTNSEDVIEDEDSTVNQDEQRTQSLSRRSSRRNRRLNRKYFGDEFINSLTVPDERLAKLPTSRTLEAAHANLKRKIDGHQRDMSFINNLTWDDSVAALAQGARTDYGRRFFNMMEQEVDPLTGLLDTSHPLAFAVKAADEDNPKWNDAVHGENSEGFWEAMLKEVSSLNTLDAWEQVPQESWMKVLPGTWAYKIKRFPTGLVRALKARFCVMGNRQTDIDPFECFAPVVSWTTVRLLLILSILLNLKSIQVDYTSAFCQAKIEEDVFIRPPRGWETLNRMGLERPFKPNHVLKLKRCLYGLRQSPKNFYEHLKERLESIGFAQSKCDPCLFIRNGVVCLVYVDDCLLFGKTQQELDQSIQDIKDAEMELTVEDDVAGFLGVLLKKNGDGTVTLLQEGLTQRIICALGLEDCNGARTPAPKAPLPKDMDGTPFAGEYNYASVVGMLMYLTGHSRPDITFAVHQCARHTHRPTEKHRKYLKQIGRYLQKTKDKGLILKPAIRDELHIECFVDADFAGLWGHEEPNDSHVTKSRTGYVIMINQCPVLWTSKLQQLTATSTMHAEYVALSTACRDIIPLREIVDELSTVYHLTTEETPVIRSTIYEDNEGALKLANTELPRTTPRSKHYGIIYHWFREHVKNGTLKVVPIDTAEQLADIFTKGLAWSPFEKLRKQLMGW